jgi:hypothetical protein
MGVPLYRVDGRPVRLVRTSLLPRGTDAMTLPGIVLIRPECTDSATLLLHESVHVRQWRSHGVTGFLRCYLGDYLRGRRRGLGHHQAYLAIGLEVEARVQAARFHAGGEPAEPDA